MEAKLNELKRLVREVRDLSGASSVLYWDQSTYMPRSGAAARGRQMALLARITQERATDPAIGRLLDELEPYASSLDFDSDDAAMIRAARRQYERNIKIPPAFAAEMTEHQTLTYSLWAEARPQNDWKKVEAPLEKILEYSRQVANFFPGYQHIADPLVDFADYGMKASDVKRVFADLRSGLVPLIRWIGEQDQVDDTCLRKHFPKEAQLKFSEEVARAFGYDFNRGRLDLTYHPFCTAFSVDDVRITTRIKEDYLAECIFSVFHETGHALYELGCSPAYEATAIVGGTSAGVHESQSRTWENIVGRSRGFWEHYYPRLQAFFPEQLNSVDVDTFYKAINKVEPSLIRTDADEVTYNLHPMIRFDLEMALLEGSLTVKDLPDAWTARYESDLGITPPDYNLGVMQDVHWFASLIGGMFQGYTLGNILSAMFYEKALQAHPEIPDQISTGEFGILHNWLKNNIYQYGSKYTAPELIEKVTGSSQLDVQPLLNYLNTKYREVYS